MIERPGDLTFVIERSQQVMCILREITTCFAAVWLGLAPTAIAYDFPLSSESIRDAYFLGRRNDEKTAKFLAGYIKRLPLPEKGPHISEISLYTPYAQIVMDSWRNAALYSGQQAEQEYRKLGDTIHVRVIIDFTSTFTLSRAVDRIRMLAGQEPEVCESASCVLEHGCMWTAPLACGQPRVSIANI